jgi:hypothetical protein
MPEANAPDGVATALQPDSGTTIPRIKLGSQGFSTLRTSNGRIYEEANAAFRMPSRIKVVDEMRLSPPVAIGMNAIRMLMNRAEMYVEPFDDTPKHRERAKFLHSCLHDMEETFQQTMQNTFPVLEYGFHVSEKVYRRRLKVNGSKYNDGLVGLKCLATRPQASIEKWNFSEDGRELVSVSQSIANLENSYRFQNLTDENGLIVIPREKFVLFNVDPTNGNPEGNSVLKAAYLAYKQLTLLTDNMMTGVAKDTQGLPVIGIPPQYMAADASDDQKAVYQMFMKIVDDLASGTQRGIVMPKSYDMDSKGEMFTVELLESKGGKAYNVLEIIKTLQANILSVLSCDAVKMGSDTAGSLSLEDGDTNLLALAVSYRLGEIGNALNKDLVQQLWSLNGWDLAELPQIKFKDVSSVSKEEFSKYIQRTFSVGGVEITRDVLNKIREVGGFKLMPDDMPVQEDILSTTMAGKASSSAEGMAVGVGNTVEGGTSKGGGKKTDNSSSNNENKG